MSDFLIHGIKAAMPICFTFAISAACSMIESNARNSPQKITNENATVEPAAILWSAVSESFSTFSAAKIPVTITNAATGDSIAGNSLSSSVVSVFDASFLSWLKKIVVRNRRSRIALTRNSAQIT